MPVIRRIRTRWSGLGDDIRRTPDGPLSKNGRRRVIEEWLAEHPRPIALLIHAHEPDYRRARAFGHTDEDINSACLLGALMAVRRFVPSRVEKFWTYALPSMRAAVQKLYYRQQVDQNNRRGEWVESIDRENCDGDKTVADMIVDQRTVDPDRSSQTAELHSTVATVIRQRIPDRRARDILTMRFGLDGRPPMTLEEVGRVVGVTRERVRQIEKRSLEKVKSELLASQADLNS